jgi:hypothetical protein
MRRAQRHDILPPIMTTHQPTIYCGRPHRFADGAPVGHACRLLDPRFLVAERDEDYLRAASILHEMPLVLHRGVPGEAGVEPAKDEAVEDMLDGDLGDPRGRSALRSSTLPEPSHSRNR